jgi:hypothetical protein
MPRKKKKKKKKKKREKMAGGCRRLHNEELHNLHASLNVVRKE